MGICTAFPVENQKSPIFLLRKMGESDEIKGSAGRLQPQLGPAALAKTKSAEDEAAGLIEQKAEPGAKQAPLQRNGKEIGDNCAAQADGDERYDSDIAGVAGNTQTV